MEAKIRKCWMVLSVGPGGEEGLVAAHMTGGFAPLIITEPRILEVVKVMAQGISDETGSELRIVEFSGRRELETYRPSKPKEGTECLEMPSAPVH